MKVRLDETLFKTRAQENLSMTNDINKLEQVDALVECLDHFVADRKWVNEISRDELLTMVTQSNGDKEVLIESVLAKFNTPCIDTKKLKECKERRQNNRVTESMKTRKSLKEKKCNRPTRATDSQKVHRARESKENKNLFAYKIYMRDRDKDFASGKDYKDEVSMLKDAKKDFELANNELRTNPKYLVCMLFDFVYDEYYHYKNLYSVKEIEDEIKLVTAPSKKYSWEYYPDTHILSKPSNSQKSIIRDAADGPLRKFYDYDSGGNYFTFNTRDFEAHKKDIAMWLKRYPEFDIVKGTFEALYGEGDYDEYTIKYPNDKYIYLLTDYNPFDDLETKPYTYEPKDYEVILVDMELNESKKLTEGYYGQTLQDFLDDCMDSSEIDKIYIHGNDDVVYEGTLGGIPDDMRETEFLECDMYTNKKSIVTVNVDSSEEYGAGMYEFLNEFLDDCNCELVVIYDIAEEEEIFNGYKEDIPEEYLEYAFNSYDAPEELSVNLNDYEGEDDFDESLKESDDKEVEKLDTFDDQMDFLAKDEQEAIDGYKKVINKVRNSKVKAQLKKIETEEKAHKDYLNKVKKNKDLEYTEPLIERKGKKCCKGKCKKAIESLDDTQKLIDNAKKFAKENNKDVRVTGLANSNECAISTFPEDFNEMVKLFKSKFVVYDEDSELERFKIKSKSTKESLEQYHYASVLKKLAGRTITEHDLDACAKELGINGYRLWNVLKELAYDKYITKGEKYGEEYFKIPENAYDELPSELKENLKEADNLQTRATKMMSVKKYQIDMAWKNGKTWKTDPMTLDEISKSVGAKVTEKQFVDMMSNNIKSRKDAKNLTKAEIVKLYDYMDGKWKGQDVLWSIKGKTNENLKDCCGHKKTNKRAK